LTFRRKVKIARKFDLRSTDLNFDEYVKVQVDLDALISGRAASSAALALSGFWIKLF